MTHSYTAVQLFDLGYGPRIVSVTPPDCELSPGTKIHPKDRGKAPGYPTHDGWTGASVHDAKRRCLDYATAKLWDESWHANVGLVVGDGYVIADNDQGEEFSRVWRGIFPEFPRRLVDDPKHTRDSFLFRVVDFVGDGVAVPNREMVFRNGVMTANFSILAQGKQSVISGVHPGTRAPYVWADELPEFDQIPAISLEEYEGGIRKFIVALDAMGWELGSGGPVRGNLGGNPSNNVGNKIPPIIPNDVFPQIAAFEALLAQIPNRDLPPGEAPNAIDLWLDPYPNWISVSYAGVAFLGTAANTPAAEDVFANWSDGRTQLGQSSRDVWRSALRQPIRYGGAGLLHIVRALTPSNPQANFPDLDPDDPALKDAPPQLPPPPAGKGRPLWDALKARWAFCMAQGFVDMLTGKTLDKQAFSDGHRYLVKALAKELGVKVKGRPPAVADLFLAQPEHVRVFDITYAPGDPTLFPSDDPVLPVFNKWKATTILAGPVGEEAIGPWLDHLLFVLGTKEERDRFLRWCAFVVQHPELKPNWHYLIMSVAGLGKDTMVAPIKLALGKRNWRETLIFSISDNFNEVVEHKLIIVGETAQPSSSFTSAHDIGTRLKPLLAQPPTEIPINRKFQAQYSIPNRLAVILFSNDDNPLHLERGQRRVHVVNRLGVAPDNLDYYWPLQQWLAGGGAEQAAKFLLSYPLSDAEKREFIGGVAPASADKDELEEKGLHPQQAALEAMIDDARQNNGVNTPRTLVATAEQLVDLLRDNGHAHPVAAQKVSSWLLGMEKKGAGVRRLKVDPRKKHQCGVTDTVINGTRYSGRLWLLSDKTSDGRLWGSLTVQEIVAIWKGLKLGSATVTPIQGAAAGNYPDDAAGNEQI